MLHASVVNHFSGHPPLCGPIEEEVDQQDQGHGRVESGQNFPSEKLFYRPRNEVMTGDGDGGNHRQRAQDERRVITELGAVGHPREDGLALDGLPNVMPHGAETQPHADDGRVQAELRGDAVHARIPRPVQLDHGQRDGDGEKGADAQNELSG